MISKGDHVNFARLVLLAVCEEAETCHALQSFFRRILLVSYSLVVCLFKTISASLRSWRDFARECFCFGSEAFNASCEAVRGFATREYGGSAARPLTNPAILQAT